TLPTILAPARPLAGHQGPSPLVQHRAFAVGRRSQRPNARHACSSSFGVSVTRSQPVLRRPVREAWRTILANPEAIDADVSRHGPPDDGPGLVTLIGQWRCSYVSTIWQIVMAFGPGSHQPATQG